MGEARNLRRLQAKQKPVQQQGQQQIQVDLKNATQVECECGCKFFIPVVTVYTVSALVNPTGQDLTAQQPVLICKDCEKQLK